MKWLKQIVRYHSTDMSRVRPESRFRDGRIWLNSAAGNIEFKPKDWRELCRFRDDVVNKFDEIRSCDKGQNARLFELYEYARSKYRVTYRANLRTRLKGIL